MSRPTTLDQLQGVWFLTHVSKEGKLTEEYEPQWPSPPAPWLLTIQGDTFHVTSNAGYYATGGWIRFGDEADRITFAFPGIPAESHMQMAFKLEGDELRLQSGGLPWSQTSEIVMATRYVRIAAQPTAEMVALIGTVMQGREWLEPAIN